MKSHLTTKELEIIKRKLPHGGIKQISEETGLDQSTVSKVLKGEFFNLTIIDSAIKLIEQNKIKSKKLKKRISNL